MDRAVKNVSPQWAEVQQGKTLPSCLGSRAANKCPFCGLLVSSFPYFSPLLVILLFNMATECSAQTLAAQGS